MPTLTDYQTFQDSTRREALRFRFDLPDNFVAGTARAIPILMFRVDCTKECTCWVHVNDSADNPVASNASIALRVTPGTGQKTVHELLRGDGFKAGRQNQILIHKAPGASGDFFVSDVALMYQLDVDT